MSIGVRSVPGWRYLGSLPELTTCPSLTPSTSSTSTSSTAEVDPFSIPHILSSILKSLTLVDIKSVQSVSRLFKEALEDDEFDGHLFRIGKNKILSNPEGPLVIHPLLQDRQYSSSYSLALLSSSKTSLSESAVWPPTENLHFTGVGFHRRLYREGGIRVKDVLEQGEVTLTDWKSIAVIRNYVLGTEWRVKPLEMIPGCTHNWLIMFSDHPRIGWRQLGKASPGVISPPPPPRENMLAVLPILTRIVRYLSDHHGVEALELSNLSRKLLFEGRPHIIGKHQTVTYRSQLPIDARLHPLLLNRKFALDDINTILANRLFPGVLEESLVWPPVKPVGLYRSCHDVRGTGKKGAMVSYDLLRVGKRVLEGNVRHGGWRGDWKVEWTLAKTDEGWIISHEVSN